MKISNSREPIGFLLTVFATVALLLHQFTAVAGAARRVSQTVPGIFPHVGGLGPQLVADAGLALLVLLVITALSGFKPWGKIRYGQPKQNLEPFETSGITSALNKPTANSLPLGLKIFLGIIALLVLAFVILHLAGSGFDHHSH